MTYSLTREELLKFAHMVYEQSAHGYLDLKEGACERLLANFLLDKKTLLPHTNVTLNSSSVIAGQNFTSDVYTITGTLVTGPTP